MFIAYNIIVIFALFPSFSKIITKLAKSRNSANTKLIFFRKNLQKFANICVIFVILLLFLYCDY